MVPLDAGMEKIVYKRNEQYLNIILSLEFYLIQKNIMIKYVFTEVK